MKVAPIAPFFDAGRQYECYHLLSPADPGEFIDALFVVVVFCHYCCELFAYSSVTKALSLYFSFGIDRFILRLMEVGALRVVKGLPWTITVINALGVSGC